MNPTAIEEQSKKREKKRRTWPLGDILREAGIDAALPPDFSEKIISDVTDDSREVTPDGIFAAIKGNAADGHLFLSDAAERGAAALIVQEDVPEYKDSAVIRVPDTRAALALLAHAARGWPSRDKLCVGCTGTNGKTTTTGLIRDCIESSGTAAALFGTVAYEIGDWKVKAKNTTPSAPLLARMFERMNERGVRAAVMEVSSHAIHQNRVLGIDFNVGVFTNLSQDHLDYHGDMDSYREVKRRFFNEILAARNDGIGVFNMDDETGRDFAANFPGRVIGYSIEKEAEVFTESFQLGAKETRLLLNIRGERRRLSSVLPGRFNVMNMTAAAAAALAAGLTADEIALGLSKAKGAPGRFELIDEGQPFSVIVDYAHTPDALKRALDAAAEFQPRRLITIFGCGGDRDAAKRPQMGAAVGEAMKRFPDAFALVTNDNPRSEDPATIAGQAEKGLLSVPEARGKFERILDRKRAMRRALSMAEAGDVVIIAGKGHEDYQQIGDMVLHFDDRETARKLLNEMGYCSE